MTDLQEDLRDPYHQRALDLVRALVPGGDTEVAIPESARSIDLVSVLGRARDAWGILRGDMSMRKVVLEHYSRPPDMADLAKCFLETAWAVEQWCKQRQGRRPPMGLVLSVGRPRVALDFFRILRPAEQEGVYRTCEPLRDHGLELILVDVRNLAPGKGTSFLRMFDHRAGTAGKNWRALLEAPDVGTLTKERIGAAMKKRKNLFQPEERSIMQLLDDKLAQGRAEGCEEGVRTTLIRQLERRFGRLTEEVKGRIQAASPRQLDAWTDAVLDARSLTAVLRAGATRRQPTRRR